MTNEKKTPRFTYNFPGQTIVGTKASFDKASKGFGPIYEELAERMAKQPTFGFEIKEPKKHTAKAKETYDGLDFPFMETYISIQSDAELAQKEYEAVKEKAKKIKRSVYPLTKKWFLDKYRGFNMDDAKRAITQAMIDGAIKSVKLAALDVATDDNNDAANTAAAA